MANRISNLGKGEELEEEIKITPEVLKDWPGLDKRIEAQRFRDELLELRRPELEKIAELEAYSSNILSLITPPQNIDYHKRK